MRSAVATGALLALTLWATTAAASETPDAGSSDGPVGDANSPDGAPTADRAPTGAEAAHVVPAAPPAALAPKPPPAPVDFAQDEANAEAAAAAESARRAEGAWPLEYVDRPQTLLENMESVALSGRAYQGPPGYRRVIGSLGYTKGLTDTIDLGLAFPRLYCGGADAGACSSSLMPLLTLRVAALQEPAARLVFGAAVTDFVYSAEMWARLKLVVPHRFSFEIEPDLIVGVRTNTTYAWWNPLVSQNGNQSRARLVFDANLQLTPNVLVWADGIPYVPVSELGSPAEMALEVAAGVSLSFTKGLALDATCISADVLPTRHWEYVPDFSGCSLTFVATRFGSRLKFHTGPIPDDFY